MIKKFISGFIIVLLLVSILAQYYTVPAIAEENTKNNPVETVLYEDGQLIINELASNKETNLSSHGEQIKVYQDIINGFDSESDIPWKDEAEEIKNITIGSKITPENTRYLLSGLKNLEGLDLELLDSTELNDISYMFANTNIINTANTVEIRIKEECIKENVFLNSNANKVITIKTDKTQEKENNIEIVPQEQTEEKKDTPIVKDESNKNESPVTNEQINENIADTNNTEENHMTPEGYTSLPDGTIAKVGEDIMIDGGYCPEEQAGGFHEDNRPEAIIPFPSKILRDISTYAYTGNTYTPGTWGNPVSYYGANPKGWIRNVLVQEKSDKNGLKMPENTIPFNSKSTTVSYSNKASQVPGHWGQVQFNRVVNKVLTIAPLVTYTTKDAGYINGRKISARCTIALRSDSTSDYALGGKTCLATDVMGSSQLSLPGIHFISESPGFYNGTSSSSSYPLNTYTAEFEIWYQDTGKYVDVPIEIYAYDLDIMSTVYNVPESLMFDSSVSHMEVYSKTNKQYHTGATKSQLRYTSKTPSVASWKGRNSNYGQFAPQHMVGAPKRMQWKESNGQYMDIRNPESFTGYGGIAYSRNGHFTIGVNANDCENFVMIGTKDYTPDPPAKLQLVKKVSSEEALVKECPTLYNLKGAEYTVYKEKNCVNAVGKLTTGNQKTGKDGKLYAESNLLSLPASTYYIKETKAPIGYKTDTKVYTINATAGKTSTISVTDTPEFNTLSLHLSKHIPDGKNWTEQFLSSAEYTVKYYPGLYPTEAKLKGTTPTRTWVFKTDNNGEIYLKDDWKIGGDKLFKNEKGETVGVFGTYTFEETKAPEGFIKNDGITIRTLEQGVTPLPIDNVNRGDPNNVAAEKVLDATRRNVVISKKIHVDDVYKPYGTPTAIIKLEGTDIYGKQKTYYKSLTLDESTLHGDYYYAEAEFKNLPAGKYYASELKTSRYKLKNIEVVNGKARVEGDKVYINLINSIRVVLSFENEITRWNDFSDMDCLVNKF